MTRPAAVIFDLDGTLTRPYLNFDAIRAEMGIVAGPILEGMASMDEAARQRADLILLRHEAEAVTHATLHDGAAEVVHDLRERGHRVGILTRNARRSVDAVLRKFGIVVDAVRTREDGAIKPSPIPLLSLCAEFGATPQDSWMIGDDRFDVLTGKAAQTRTILMIGDRAKPQWDPKADYVVRGLGEITAILLGG